ncbi:UvrD-helicase domain-containing protein [Flavobacterium nackdongense]|uniref:DNA 3'-5' helicase n=1 Tax=Flavobacterium nackdongense TaxID=2547394 RepID=A0A4P6YDT0_9FLAO|nr:UvrD-helicase domain-containing protein [Flavobacterium nackdongense]QBN19044.1 ATP-dependent helicase [Flavobacterium nackdongense]
MQRPSFSIYDASAGSGKTYALVKEYLKIILVAPKNDAYRNILAITFTNKAVHEMKSRIVGSLSEFAKDEPSQKAQDLMQDLAKETQLSIVQIKTKSQQIIKHIIHNYAAFDISTIDKFTHKVIRAFAHDLGLQMNFEVSLESDNLLTEAVDALIAQAGEDETLTKLLVDFTMEKTDDDKSWDISREIFEVGKLIQNENNREEIAHFKDKTITDFVEIKKKLAEVSKVLEEENASLAETALQLIEKNAIDIKSFSRGTFPNHLQSIAERKFNPKNKLFREFEDISINKTAKDRAIIENIIPELLQILAGIYKNFEQRDFYLAFLKNITPLSLLNTVSKELDKIQKEQNVLSISEFNTKIHSEIQNQPAPFIYERLGERYRHFFIDEFQDTSEMQWQNLIPLIDNATSSEFDGEKGTLMIVGDPKQSIYRWRGGKAEQFIELSKSYNPFNNPEKVLEHLDKNYRSYSQIIDFNNRFFQMLSHKFDPEGSGRDYKDLYENHSYQKSNSKTGGYVNISFLPLIEKEADSEEEEELNKMDLYVRATLKTILEVKQKGFKFSDIVVLVRHNKNGTAIANYLVEQGIPMLSSESLLIKNATEVRFILHFLRYLKNNKDAESKAYFLEYLARNNREKMPIHDFILAGMKMNEVDFEEWLMTFGVSLAFSDIRKKSLYEAVETIIKAVLPSKRNTAYIQHFLDIVLEKDVRNNAGISDFLEYWDKSSDKFKIPSPEGSDAVQIMSIHKSKGLEFPVVIFPFAEENYSLQKKDKLWLSADQEEFGLPKVLVDNSKAVEGFGTAAKATYIEKSQEQLLDNINVLYVALTRAEEQLYVISSLFKANKEGNYPNNMASFFIDYLTKESNFDETQLAYDFGHSERISSATKAQKEFKAIPQVAAILDSKNIKIAQKESIMWGTHQQEAIEYGNVVHEVLSFVATKKDVDLAITKAIESGLITVNQKEVVCKTIQEIVNHSELSICFEEGSQVLNEQTIIQKEGKTIKPDRMVLTKAKEVYLLDYKTGLYNAKHRLQLENYQNAIELMGYKVLKKSIVYIGEEINVINL